MSIVVVYKKNGIYYMGADTQSTCGDSISRNLNDGYKIAALDNGLYIGACGSMAAYQHLLATPSIFEIEKSAKFTKRYVVRNIIPKLYTFLSEHSYMDEDSRKLASELSLLLVGRGKMFEIRSDFCVVELKRFGVIGAGCELVQGAVACENWEEDPNQILLRLMRISAKYNNTISAPYVLIDTKDNEFKMEEV